MKRRILIWSCLSILAAVPAFAQTKTVTNTDLEKFRQKRLQAEKEYRENYQRLGFPSPEELSRQIEKDGAEREALAARLMSERLERERIAAEAEQYSQREPSVYVVPDGGSNGYYYGSPSLIYRNARFGRQNFLYTYPVRVGNGIPINTFGNPVRTHVNPIRMTMPGPRHR